MIQKITDNVYRVHRKDMAENLTAIFEKLRDDLRCSFTYLVTTKRGDEKINGGAKYLDGLDLDFRGSYYIIVKQHPDLVPTANWWVQYMINAREKYIQKFGRAMPKDVVQYAHSIINN